MTPSSSGFWWRIYLVSSCSLSILWYRNCISEFLLSYTISSRVYCLSLTSWISYLDCPAENQFDEGCAHRLLPGFFVQSETIILVPQVFDISALFNKPILFRYSDLFFISQFILRYCWWSFTNLLSSIILRFSSVIQALFVTLFVSWS